MRNIKENLKTSSCENAPEFRIKVKYLNASNAQLTTQNIRLINIKSTYSYKRR